jgi:hypothetical protein
MTSPSILPDAARRAELLAVLLVNVDRLHRRQAHEIPEQDIDDYVALDWLVWHGGGLKLTTTGENMCKQLAAKA